MKERLKKIRKIPVPISLGIFLFSLVLGFFSINKSRQFFSRALTKNSPRQVKITDITDTSFVVSWITEEKTSPVVTYGETVSLGTIKKDVRDIKDNGPSYLTHYFLIDNLRPETKYYFKIILSGRLFDNGGKPYEVTTGPTLNPSENDIAQGRILDPSGLSPAPNSIVYLSTANTITQSALTDSNGNWMIPLSIARASDLKSFLAYDRTSQIIEIFTQGEKEVANATLSSGNDNPAPDIILGQNFNFLNQVKEGEPTPAIPVLQSENQGITDLSGFQGTLPLTISYPSEDEKVNTQIPEFFGSGPKNKKLNVLVESDQTIDDETQVNQNGKWQWSPKQVLSPGEHTITVSYTNDQGFLEKVTRTFSILAYGESNLPAFTATSSATITSSQPSPSPTSRPVTATPTIRTLITATPPPTISPEPSIEPTITPSLTPIPTEEALSPTPSISTLTPTPTEEVSRTTMPSTSSGVYKSGTAFPTVLLSGIGTLVFLVGLVLVFF